MDRHAGDDAGYDSDFYAWTIAQAAAVRRAGELRPNQDADWETTVNKARAHMRRKLTRTLRRKLRDEFLDAWKNGRKYAASGLARDSVKPESLPVDCPWSFESLVDDDFLPPETHAEPLAEPQA